MFIQWGSEGADWKCSHSERGNTHVRRGLLQVRGHLHAALIQQPQLTEQQTQLAQVFLKLAEAVLVHGLALRHAVRQLITGKQGEGPVTERRQLMPEWGESMRDQELKGDRQQAWGRQE